MTTNTVDPTTDYATHLAVHAKKQHGLQSDILFELSSYEGADKDQYPFLRRAENIWSIIKKGYLTDDKEIAIRLKLKRHEVRDLQYLWSLTDSEPENNVYEAIEFWWETFVD